MKTTKREETVGVVVKMSRDHRRALNNLVRLLGRESDHEVSQSSVVLGYMTRDPRFMSELRRVKTRKE